MTWALAEGADLDAVGAALTDADRDSLRIVCGEDPDRAGAYLRQQAEWGAKAMAVRLDGQAVALVGVSSQRPGVGVVWAWTTPRAREVGSALTRGGKRLLAALMRSGVYHRLEAWCWTGHPTSERWVRALGLERECTMRRAGLNGEDIALWSRI